MQEPNQYSNQQSLSNDLFKDPQPSNLQFHQFFLQQNLNIPIINPIASLCSPSPFKKGVLPLLGCQSQEEKEESGNGQEYSLSSQMNLKENSLFGCQVVEFQKCKKRQKPVKETKSKERSLKKLSKQVHVIMMKLRIASYKQVAGELLVNLRKKNYKNSLFTPLTLTEEHNIRRRVYDALNVMIACRIFQKRKKKVVYENSFFQEIQEELESKTEDIRETCERVREMAEEKEKILLKKRYNCEMLKYRVKTLEGFLDRNKQKSQCGKKINFPIIGILYESEKEKKIQVTKIKQKTILRLEKLLGIGGDIDLLMGLMKSERKEEAKRKSQIIYRF